MCGLTQRLRRIRGDQGKPFFELGHEQRIGCHPGVCPCKLLYSAVRDDHLQTLNTLLTRQSKFYFVVQKHEK